MVEKPINTWNLYKDIVLTISRELEIIFSFDHSCSVFIIISANKCTEYIDAGLI